jgi:hypothetical protein
MIGILTKSMAFAKNEAPMDLLSRILKRILESNSGLKSGMHEARILELWEAAIGMPIARHARAVQIRGTILTVAVTQSVWRQELLGNKQLVLEKFNQRLKQELGEPASGPVWITDIFFVGSAPSANPTKAGKGFRKK